MNSTYNRAATRTRAYHSSKWLRPAASLVEFDRVVEELKAAIKPLLTQTTNPVRLAALIPSHLPAYHVPLALREIDEDDQQ